MESRASHGSRKNVSVMQHSLLAFAYRRYCGGDDVLPDCEGRKGVPLAEAQVIVKTPFIPAAAWPATVHLYG